MRHTVDADGLVFVDSYRHLFPVKPGVLLESERMTDSEYGSEVSSRATACLWRSVCLALVVWATMTHPATARQFTGDVNDPYTAYARTLQLVGDSSLSASGLILPMWGVAPASGGPWSAGPGLGDRSVPSQGFHPSWWGIQGQALYVSGYPTDRLDGPIWRGKGMTVAVDAGVGSCSRTPCIQPTRGS